MYVIELQELTKEKIIWQQEIDDIELVAGIMAGSIPALQLINTQLPEKNYLLYTDTDLSPYRLYNYVDENLLKGISIDLPANEYGIWLKSDLTGYCHLYRFTKMDFLQGIISICSNFNLDFRTILKSLPFDNLGRPVKLYDYELNDNNYAVDVLDSNDYDDEEKDNENVIELLIKDY